jgi:hypothetical protein
MAEHHFGEMPKSVRSVCITLAENEAEITIWRDSLTERQRQKWRHPLTLTRHWRTSQPPSDPPDGAVPMVPGVPMVPVVTTFPIATFKHDAEAAWRRFVSCVEALPADQGAPLWHEVQARAAQSLRRDVRLPPDTKAFGPKLGPKHNETGRNEPSLDSLTDPR